MADYVWERFGNVDSYCEPFMGSLAVLLRRPLTHFGPEFKVRKETVTDVCHFIPNFWRAVVADPEAVAHYCDGIVCEVDMHARHRWLVSSPEAIRVREQMRADPDFYDAKVAGWWCWGISLWIGSGWCHDGAENWNQIPPLNKMGTGDAGAHQIPLLSGAGDGEHRPHDSTPVPPPLSQQIIDMDGSRGVHRATESPPSTQWGQRPILFEGSGCDTTTPLDSLPHGRPQLTDAYDIGRGVHANGTAGTCAARREWLIGWMRALSDRLRLVRVCYGDWSRICDSDSTLTRLGTCGVLLDPPYPTVRADTGEASRDPSLYAHDGDDLNALRDDVLAWCKRWGNDPNIRVALCCYESDGYEPLLDLGWEIYHWTTAGGYANQSKKRTGKNRNATRERIFFNSACLKERQPGLFD